MIKLPQQLDDIEGLSHAIYADDITLWTKASTTGRQQTTLQEAIDLIEQYLSRCGLQCAPEKSELLILKARTRGRPPAYVDPDPNVTLNGIDIPQVDSLRVLGLTLHKDGSGAATLPKLQKTLTQVTHLIRRITTQRRGLKEQETVQIIQALLISRITYGTPYLLLKKAEIEKLNIVIRKAIKSALGLPSTTSTTTLLKLGLHNTWEEMSEAHRASQLERLKLTQTGRAVLRKLAYSENFIADSDVKARLPPLLRDSISVAPIPRNMHATHHKDRRQARVRALSKKYSRNPNTRYTDAAKYPGRRAYAITVTNNKGNELVAATIPARNPETAEEVAIILGIATCKDTAIILSDSQTACRNLQKGRISAAAVKILKELSRRQELPETYVVWTPGHEHLAGNEAAHAVSREHTSRDFLPHGIRKSTRVEDIPINYAVILQHYRLERREYPLPHPKLSKEEATALRRLQTNTYVHGIIMHRMHPTKFSYLCRYCDVPDTLQHMVLVCPHREKNSQDDASETIQATEETWEAMLTAQSLEDQRSLVDRARAAALANGFLD